MQKQEAEFLRRMIIRYCNLSDGPSKNGLRNEIYSSMLPFMQKWIRAILSKKKIFLAEDEILSQSWDCFEFGLKHFKMGRKISVPNHFYAYSRFYLMSWVAEQIKKQREYEGVVNDWEHHTEADDLLVIYENIDELKGFRDCIPYHYRNMFDNEILLMIGKPPKKNLYKNQESKKIFRLIIDYLLKR